MGNYHITKDGNKRHYAAVVKRLYFNWLRK